MHDLDNKDENRPPISVYSRIDPEAMRHNFGAFRNLLPKDTAIAAVIKSDGYGHGMQTVARIALEEGCPILAVQTVEEALGLRNANLDCDILVMGSLENSEAETIIKNDLSVFVGNLCLAQALGQAAQKIKKPVRVHLKFDTGMGRFGFLDDPVELRQTLDVLLKTEGLEIEGLATHLSCADEASSEFTTHQLQRFDAVISTCGAYGIEPRWIHAANSAGVLYFPQSCYSLTRIGIGLYGGQPDPCTEQPMELMPAMSLICRIVEIRDLPAKSTISYGATYVTKRPSRIAVLPVGYGNGYPRSASNKAYVLIHGQAARIMGRVTMNTILVDVTDISQAQTGDNALLFGADEGHTLPVEELANAAGMISYEVFCNVGRGCPRIVQWD